MSNQEVMGIDRNEWRIEGWVEDSALMNVPYHIRRDNTLYVKYDWFPKWVPIARYEIKGKDTLIIQWMNEPFNKDDLENPDQFLLNPRFSESEPSIYTRFSERAVEAGEKAYRRRKKYEKKRKRLFRCSCN